MGYEYNVNYPSKVWVKKCGHINCNCNTRCPFCHKGYLRLNFFGVIAASYTCDKCKKTTDDLDLVDVAIKRTSHPLFDKLRL